MLASDVMNQAGANLNDQSLEFAPFTVQLPHLKTALGNLQAAYLSAQIPILDEEYVETIEAGETAFDTQPTTIITPTTLFEKAPTEPNSMYIPMVQRTWPSDQDPTTILGCWTWEKNQIIFPVCLNDRVVKMQFQKVFSDIANENSVIPAGNGTLNYLGFRTGALVAALVLRNNEVATALNELAQEELEVHLNIMINEQQNQPQRRQAAYNSGKFSIRR